MSPAPVPPTLGLGPIRQNGYVVQDMDAALHHWTAVLGVGPFYLVEKVELDWFSCGESRVVPDLTIALGNSGVLQIELICQHDDAPSMYTGMLAGMGEGLHHVAYWSTDYQAHHDRLLTAGYRVGQEGQVGGSAGRFVYYDTDGPAGSLLELSDVSGPKGAFFEHIREANEDWDGSRPVRRIS